MFSSRNWWKRSYWKKTRGIRKKLNCTFIRINFDADYEASEIQAFISRFKDNEIKEGDNKSKKLEDEIKEKDNKNKELEDEIEKLKLQLAKLSVKNNDVNDKK